MARESKEERAARESNEQQEQYKLDCAAWPARVMQALVDATTEGFEITAKQFAISGQRFVVAWTDGYSDRCSAMLSMSPPPTARGEPGPFGRHESWGFIDELERAVVDHREMREEANRRATLRLKAISKLSKEEREVLGL